MRRPMRHLIGVVLAVVFVVGAGTGVGADGGGNGGTVTPNACWVCPGVTG